MTDPEIITRLDRIIELLEAIHAQGQPKANAGVILQERDIAVTYSPESASSEFAAKFNDFIQQLHHEMYEDENKP